MASPRVWLISHRLPSSIGVVVRRSSTVSSRSDRMSSMVMVAGSSRSISLHPIRSARGPKSRMRTMTKRCAGALCKRRFDVVCCSR